MFLIIFFASASTLNTNSGNNYPETKAPVIDNTINLAEPEIYDKYSSGMENINDSFMMPDNPILKILGIKTEIDDYKKLYLERQRAFRQFLIKKYEGKKNNIISNNV